MSLTQKLTTIATQLISSLGYGGLAFGLIIDSAGIPIPSEVLLPLAGALARQGRFNLVLVIIVGTLAQTAGAALSYWIGAQGGLPLVKKYGKYVLFREHELHRTHALFEKYGAWLTLIGRCVPGVRTYIGYPAGIARMRFDLFMAASVVGSLVWTILLSVLGYQLANKLDVIDRIVRQFGLIALAVGVVALFVYIYHNNKRSKNS